MSDEFGEVLVEEARHLKTVVDRLSSERDFYRDELEQVRLVLEWASENVQCLNGIHGKFTECGVAFGKGNKTKFIKAHTVYEALHAAWENRDNKK